MASSGEYKIGATSVHIGAADVTTAYGDGSCVYAVPDGTQLQTAIALSLGYGADSEAVEAMTRDHDTLHTLLADARGWQHSETLWHLAHGDELPPEVVDDEERIVMLIQRLLNVGIDGVLSDHSA